MIKTLFKSVREFKKPSILSMVIVFLEVIMECFMPLVMKNLLDEMNGGQLNNVWKYSIVLVIMAFASLTFGVIAGKQCAKASAGLSKNLRYDLYKAISDFSFSNIDKFSTSSLVTRMTTDVFHVQMAYMMIIRTAVRSPFMLIFSIIMGFIISPKMAWIFVIIVPILLAAFILIIIKAMPRFNRVFKRYDALNNSIQENVSGIRTVKSYVREEHEKEKFNKASTNVANDFIGAERIVAFNQPVLQFAIYALNLTVIFIGATLIINTSSLDSVGDPIWGDLSVGGLSSLLTYGMQCLMSLMMLSFIIVMVTLAIESGRRICEVLNEKSDLTNPENPVFEVENGSIDFNNVSFKYNVKAERNTLENVNLHILSGQTVGIIGGTGSSKTSLVNLISRLYDVTEGEVLVGGINVKEYDIKSLRNQVSVVLQKNLLFSGTIKDNLRWGNEQATDEEMIYACKQACAHEFIETFPDKYDTYIEQGGTNVSGGQKQRLCIARALLKKPKILILDDSTSAVDTKTDAIIRSELKNAIPETTKIIIAQRIASIIECDQIIVMNNGKVDQIGTHEELLATNNIYQEVYYTQNQINNNGGANNE